MPSSISHSEAWPPLPYRDWEPTKQTLHRFVQIAGKIRMALTPSLNHWWHVTLYVGTRGLSTGPMPYGDRDVEIAFDLVDQRLRVGTSEGDERGFRLVDPLPCGDFYSELFSALEALGVEVAIHAEPFDLGDSPAFPDDTVNVSFDADAVTRYWQVLGASQRVMAEFAGRFNGKASPIHLFWHSFDLAYGRYSGRRAPRSDGVDPVSAEAYSHEVIAFGFWPGDARRTPYPAYYSYTAPEPAGLRDVPLTPAGARWEDTGSGSLAILPYDDVRTSEDPRATLLAFLESAYRAGASTAGWDVEDFATRSAPGRDG
ncbi:MAG: Ava_C0101 and related proteins [uncultured Solirubrobacteraceae bacterium]|uniref:Ava_C0101 and related proteins n=1 Tax=uncultured Solirubrobacteraceae bacterium TaxID=1162706 RepID=A0A6J4R3R1_9ACTN|nr:MAG: Ava_C0101 and related proteins [uncultured Solirubrobacteraceae bacterium]